jgi:hypothetical protein
MEAIGANSLGTLILKVHLKSVQKFFLSKVVTCVSLFEHLTEKSLNRLHESILERDTTILLLTSFFIYLLICIKHA